MDELTPEELSNLTPEEQDEYFKLLEEEKQYQQSVQASQPSAPEEMEQDISPVPEEEGFFEQAYGAIKPVVEPLKEMGLAAEKGFEQGLLSGGAEEARAAALSAFPDVDYETALKQQEEAFKKSEEESPISTFAGELAGSVAQGAALTAATGGFALPTALANALSKLSKVNKATKIATKAIKPTTRIAKTAALGAAEGAAQATLRSEKSLYEQAKEGFKEAKTGATSGAVFGGGLEATSKAIKGAGGAIGEFISKKIDEGKMPPSMRPIREAYKMGKKGLGFSSEESLERPVKDLMNVVEKKLQPKVYSSLREVKELSDYILENVPKKIEIDDIVESGVAKLKSEGHLDANKFADYIKNKYKALKAVVPEAKDIYGQPTGDIPKISLKDAKLFVRDLDRELRAKPQLSETFKDTINGIRKSIDSLIDSTVTDADAVEAVLQNPEQTLNFLNILRKSSPASLAEKELSKMGEVLKGDKALKKAKETANKIVKNYKTSIDSVMKELDELPSSQQLSKVAEILQNPRSKSILEEAAKNLGPVKILDSKMKNILNAQELLTGDTFPKTDVEKAENVMDLFRMIAAQTKEGVTSDVNRAKYNKALDFLSTAMPEIAEDIEKSVKPITDDLFMIRYLHGIGFDPALKDTAIVQKVLGPAGKLAAQASNITAQSIEAAKKGVAGPIVGLPSTTMIRPTVSVLKSLQSRIDPKSGKIAEMVSERLQDAINAPDEGRRLAILNTLMQYSYFRNMVNEENVD